MLEHDVIIVGGGLAGLRAAIESSAVADTVVFPQRDDEHYLKHTLAHHTPSGPKLDYVDVKITGYKPEASKY